MTGSHDFVVQGWCPGALRPMMSGDGLVVRVRPMSGRLMQEQAMGLARAARTYGNGLIDLSNRANVQLRGVTPENHPGLIKALDALGLIDPDQRSEARRNVLITPFADARTDHLAAQLMDALADAPELPGKFGFAVDTGPAPILSEVPADIRLERDSGGQLVLRCDGFALGATVDATDAAQKAVALAHWFVRAGGVKDGRGRMAALLARGSRPEGDLAPTLAPARPVAPPRPGIVPEGALIGFDFGQMEAETLMAIADLGPIRITPWRMVLVEGVTTPPDVPGALLNADEPLLRVRACTGAPGCLQALRAVRPLARRIAPQVPVGKVLHVSGCAKGCAHPAPADLTLIATVDGFDLVKGGTAQDSPDMTALSEDSLDLRGLV